MAKRSPWFNARTQPPVNGGDFALYEHQCPGPTGTGDILMNNSATIKAYGAICPHCQWRGLLRESDDGK